MSVVPPLNPVLAREIKERLRTRRATIIVTVYLALLSLLLYVIHAGATRAASSDFGNPMASQSATLGRIMFETILLVMLGLVLFIVPGLTADAVTGERERQTLVPLQVSLLRPRSILAGKLLASVAFTALLVVATLPLFGISFIVGGVSVGQVGKGVVAVLVAALIVGSLTLWCSSVVRRTQVAIVLAYFVVFLLVAGSLAFYGAQWVFSERDHDIRNGRVDRPGIAVLHLNPFLAVADFVAGPVDGVDAPVQGIADFVRRLEDRAGDDRWMAEERLEIRGEGVVEGAPVPVPNDGPVTTALGDPNAPTIVTEEIEVGAVGAPIVASDDEVLLAQAVGRRSDAVPFWARSTLLLAALSVGAFVLATRRIRTPSDRAAS